MVAKKHEESGNGGKYVAQFTNLQNGTKFIVGPVVFWEWAFRRQRLRGAPGLAYSWFRHALAIYCFLAFCFWAYSGEAPGVSFVRLALPFGRPRGW